MWPRGVWRLGSRARTITSVMSAAKKILEDALALSEEERESLANALLTSLGGMPQDVEQAWADEAVRRLEREARGETKAIPWEEAKRQIRERFGFE